jgi:hypothetical protein
VTACGYLDRGVLAADPAAALVDPHVASCPACRHAAASMAWIVDAVPRLAAGHGPPAGWEARVLAAVALAEPTPARRYGWWMGASVAAMAAAVVAYLAVPAP